MTLNATDTLASPDQLPFARSAHQHLGTGNSLTSNIENFAPPIVGGMRLAAALLPIAAVSLGIEDPEALEGALPFLSLHGAGLIGSELILLAYGSKDQREQAAQEYADQPEPSDWKKPLNPKRYPLESSAALDVIGELSMVIGGTLMLSGLMTEGLFDFLGLHTHGAEVATVEECVDHGEDMPAFGERRLPPAFLENIPHDHVHCSDIEGVDSHAHHGGWAFILHGVTGLAAHLPIVFGREKGHSHGILGHGVTEHGTRAEPSLNFKQSKSEAVGVIGKAYNVLRDNPIQTASALQVLVGMSLIATFPGSWSLVASGAIIAASAVLQGLFVRKEVDSEVPASRIQTAQLDAPVAEPELAR